MRNVDIKIVKAARAWAARYYREHKEDHLYEHPSHLASEAITEAGKKYGIGFGCEGFCWDCGQEGVSYLNMGDTYDATILFDTRTGHFTVGCYGDIVEKLQNDGIELD